MINLNDYITEKFKISKDIEDDIPEVGKIAYDYNGLECEIKAVASTDDFDACERVALEWDEPNNQYGWLEFKKEEKIGPKRLKKMTPYIVGAVFKDAELKGQKVWYVWGGEGLSYKNK